MELLCKMLGGSHAYGLATPASDVDNRGVFLNTDLKYVLGLDKYEHQQFTEGGADDKFKEFRHFLQLLRDANTEALEMLFNETWELCDPLFVRLQKDREHFLDSTRLFKALCGYMQGERRRANGELKGKLGKRREALETYGFSPKNFVQLFRLAWAGTVFFAKGYFPVNVATEDNEFAKFLLDLKTHPEGYEVSKLNMLAEKWEQKLKAAYDGRTTTYQFNQKLADEYVLRAYMPVLNRAYDKLAIADVCAMPTCEQISARLIQECDCATFRERIGVHIDSQDLYEGGYTKCPYCKTPFESKQSAT